MITHNSDATEMFYIITIVYFAASQSEPYAVFLPCSQAIALYFFDLVYAQLFWLILITPTQMH
ncbi:hypothetical protein BD408DRAFT_173634 [Parasitella parasitica]|nr:hypothetical protein BD408DRAFT_173634 [Parasitella parasitica]